MKKIVWVVTFLSIFSLNAMDSQLSHDHNPDDHRQELLDMINNVTTTFVQNPPPSIQISSVHQTLQKTVDTIPGESCLKNQECCGQVINEISSHSPLEPEEVALYFDTDGSTQWLQKRVATSDESRRTLRSFFETFLYDGRFHHVQKIADIAAHSSLLNIALQAKGHIEINDPDDDDQLEKIIETLQKPNLHVSPSMTTEK